MPTVATTNKPATPISAPLLFPGRSVLYVYEVAEKLRITREHVSSLIEEGKLEAIDAGGGSRKSWRIPVQAYEKFLQARHSLTLPPSATLPSGEAKRPEQIPLAAFAVGVGLAEQTVRRYLRTHPKCLPQRFIKRG
ncbi:MAG: helix-turn-helix domain-containing protein, partial [Verrucomicrobia bacterium]|nr:helix-turn-helix domain-containing protein [Verrucomicrobiota bacterium]